MKKMLIYTISLIFLVSTAVIAADAVKGKVMGVKDGKVLIKVGDNAKKFKKGDAVTIKKESGEALTPELQGC